MSNPTTPFVDIVFAANPFGLVRIVIFEDKLIARAFGLPTPALEYDAADFWPQLQIGGRGPTLHTEVDESRECKFLAALKLGRMQRTARFQIDIRTPLRLGASFYNRRSAMVVAQPNDDCAVLK